MNLARAEVMMKPVRLFDQWIMGLGRIFTTNIGYTLRVLLMCYLAFRSLIKDKSQSSRTILSVVLMQIYFTGWQAMPLITILSLASGTMIIFQSLANLNLLGGSQMMGGLLIAIIVREVAPLMTALLVVARSGTAVASEIGNMRANREIDALESMGINPISFIVLPRLLGGVISVVSLAIYFVLISLLGGFTIVKLLQNISFQFYIESISRAVASEDVGLFLLKNCFSGIIIFAIACDQGLSVQQSPTEVPVVTTRAVVKSIIYVILFNLSVSVLFYLKQLMKLGVIQL
jgi:phospholipid/cholesterol/gamma-HCH transport system permease protein